MREEDAGGGLGPLVPDRNKPACRTNNGVLDAHYRPKLAFYSVRQMCGGRRRYWSGSRV